jgi:hypothetical protein
VNFKKAPSEKIDVLGFSGLMCIQKCLSKVVKMKEVVKLFNDALRGCTPTNNEHRHLPHDL